MQGHLYGVNTLTVSSDNKYIISGSNDRTIRIWNFLEKKQEIVLDKLLSWLRSLAITKNNKYFISGFDDNKIRV